MKEGRYFGMSKRHTFKELADEYEPHAKDKVRLDYWRGVFGSDLLADITPDRIAKQRDKLLTEDTHRFAKPATGRRGSRRATSEGEAERPDRQSLPRRPVRLSIPRREGTPVAGA